MRILFVSAEVAPFSSVGGLSQVMYFLPRALAKIGHDVRIFTAKYGQIDGSNGVPKPPKSPKWKLSLVAEGLKVPVGNNGAEIVCNIKSARAILPGRQPNSRDTLVYFLENQEYYEQRANVYQYADDHVRFALLSKGCLEWLLQSGATRLQGQQESKNTGYQDNRLKGSKADDFQPGNLKPASLSSAVNLSAVDAPWFPDVIHINDWHTGYLADMARRDKRYQEAFAGVAVVYTVHNFRHQGNGAWDFRYSPPEKKDWGESPLPDLFSPKLIEANALLRGIRFADAVNTVSKTHAEEVLTAEYGEGLDQFLLGHKHKLTGILNGLDLKEFDPATDNRIKHHYSWRSVGRRLENKLSLQREFSLPRHPKVPLLAISGRLDRQKGIELLVEALPRLLSHYEFQFVELGGGEESYRNFFSQLAAKYPDRVSVHLQPNFILPRKLFAGADVMLIPSRFEPGGIVALEAMRYGAVPLVRRTGGLNDIVVDFDPETVAGNGISFKEFDPWAFYGAVVSALTLYRDQDGWKKLVINCMREDASWDHVAREYEEYYTAPLAARLPPPLGILKPNGG